MLQFAQQIKDGLDLSKGQETSIHEAKSVLNQGRRYRYGQYSHGRTTFPAGFFFSLTLIYDY